MIVQLDISVAVQLSGWDLDVILVRTGENVLFSLLYELVKIKISRVQILGINKTAIQILMI